MKDKINANWYYFETVMTEKEAEKIKLFLFKKFKTVFWSRK